VAQGDDRPASILRFADPAPAEAAVPTGGVSWAMPGAGAQTAVVQRVETQVVPAEAAMPDLDALARKLYPMIRPYLKRELWLDRERAGMLTDLM